MPEIPAPAHVLQALAPLWPPLYTALEWATQQTRAYFDAEDAPIDRNLAPSLVRYQAKRYLARLGHAAQEEDGEDGPCVWFHRGRVEPSKTTRSAWRALSGDT